MESDHQKKNTALREINFEYQEFLNKFYKLDKQSLKKWLDQNYGEYFCRKIDETTLDKDMIIIKDSTQRELVEDCVCAICLGIVRLPAKMCNHCSKIFCEMCVNKISGIVDQNNQNDNIIEMIGQS